MGGTHRVAVDAKRNRVYVVQDADNRLLAFDLAGQKVWQVEKLESSALAVDPKSGNVWVTGGPNLKTGQTVVFDPSGNEVAAYPVSGIDLVFDAKADAVWLAGYELIKLSSSGEFLFREPVAGWCYASIGINPRDGSVWVAEREHPDVAKSQNRLWLRNADGSVRRELPLGEANLFVVGADPATGDAIYSGYNNPLHRVGASGEPMKASPLVTRNVAFGGEDGKDLWIVTDEGVSRLNSSGEAEVTYAFPKKSGQGWIATR